MIKKIRKLRPVPTNCIFCKGKTEPDYKDVESLEKYMSERGRITGKARTGICAKHQRKISISVKRARYIGLLPFIVKPH